MTVPMLEVLKRFAALAAARRKAYPATFEVKARAVHCSELPAVLNGLTEEEMRATQDLQRMPGGEQVPYNAPSSNER